MGPNSQKQENLKTHG